ncbi:MAG: hypothetical protein AMJ54_03045 [Deltaproteobacteria bacterium SG8_13]|nr:MAG: hypothetical protein AMJ54_03045 [Deltaproteobacteria bacterium SG8_13]
MKRWTAISLGLLFACALLFSGPFRPVAHAFKLLGNGDKSPRVIVVLVDMSGSTNKARRTVYNEAFDKIYENLQQGDRLVIGTITSNSYIDFKPVVDAEIPKQSIWVNRIQYEQNVAKTRKEIRKEVDGLLSQRKGTQYTEILNSLNIADTIFHSEKRRKILVILSDMMQDSKEYRFERVRITESFTRELIRQRKRQNLVPNLAEVKIYVAGASAANSKKFRSIERFWAHYFDASGADYSTHRYGHSLLEFEKET